MEFLKLNKEIVSSCLKDSQAGAYSLAIKRDGKFNVKYVGRSDTCLKTRLLQHVKGKKSKYFSFAVCDTDVQAYHLECRGFHSFSALKNAIHPDNPNLKVCGCPYCATEWEFANALKHEGVF